MSVFRLLPNVSVVTTIITANTAPSSAKRTGGASRLRPVPKAKAHSPRPRVTGMPLLPVASNGRVLCAGRAVGAMRWAQLTTSDQQCDETSVTTSKAKPRRVRTSRTQRPSVEHRAHRANG